MKLELSARSHDLLFSREFNNPVIPVNPVTFMSFAIPLLQKYSLLGLKSHKCLTRLSGVFSVGWGSCNKGVWTMTHHPRPRAEGQLIEAQLPKLKLFYDASCYTAFLVRPTYFTQETIAVWPVIRVTHIDVNEVNFHQEYIINSST